MFVKTVVLYCYDVRFVIYRSYFWLPVWAIIQMLTATVWFVALQFISCSKNQKLILKSVSILRTCVLRVLASEKC